jgi:hypothetical protein|tara:strand:- start:720 stop:902 length:183 start_codon:yes stop_codon:yes gene_type:complete
MDVVVFIALMVYSLVFPEPEYDPYNDERITVVSPATEEAINSEIEYNDERGFFPPKKSVD